MVAFWKYADAFLYQHYIDPSISSDKVDTKAVAEFEILSRNNRFITSQPLFFSSMNSWTDEFIRKIHDSSDDVIVSDVDTTHRPINMSALKIRTPALKYSFFDCFCCV